MKRDSAVRKPNPDLALPPLCPKCGYNASGLAFVDGFVTCPECGDTIDDAWARTMGDFQPSQVWGLLVPGACLLLAMGCLLIPFQYKPEVAIAILLAGTVLCPIVTAWRASIYKFEGHKPAITRRVFQVFLFFLASTFITCIVGSFVFLNIAVAFAMGR